MTWMRWGVTKALMMGGKRSAQMNDSEWETGKRAHKLRDRMAQHNMTGTRACVCVCVEGGMAFQPPNLNARAASLPSSSSHACSKPTHFAPLP